MNNKRQGNNKQLKISNPKNNNDANYNINSPDMLINTLKVAITETKRQYKALRKEYIDEVRKKTEAQQLLQKCIEDLKLEISLSSKDLQNFSK